jgi:holo-[acyl-carrier protein] synthase
MRRELAKGSGEFAARIFTPAEISYCRGKRYPERHFAARFAAKEAFFKAVSNGERVDIHWPDIEISNDTNGKPHIDLRREAGRLSQLRGASRIFVSLSHSDDWAMATVILES